MIKKEIVNNYLNLTKRLSKEASSQGLKDYQNDIKKYKGFLSIETSQLDFLDPEDYNIYFLGEKLNTTNLIDKILRLKPDKTILDVINNLPKSEEIEKELVDYFSYDLENYDNIQELKEDLTHEVIDFYTSYGYVDHIAAASGLNIGKVGYSGYSYYISDEAVTYDFITDLWNGWSWYDLVILNSSGEEIDFISDNYIKNEKDFKDIAGDFLKLEDYKIIDNTI